ncbi:MAG: DUF6596 domain-containing protein [Reyranellaceae bacterium]
MVAALARRLGAGGIALAEDAVQHALLQALTSWPFHGVPSRPEAWLATVARNRALDQLRRDGRSVALADGALGELPAPPSPAGGRFDRELNDDELALLFAVCHPLLSSEGRVTFALKTVCGLDVPQIAAGLLAAPTTIAQRLVRARRTLARARVAIEAPPPEALPERVESVRTTLFVMFSEGYSASSGEALVQPALCVEALRLARALAGHPVTAGPASDALAALLALTAARLPTRVDAEGVAVLLADQARERWDRGLIALGLDHLLRAAAGETLTVWHLRAEIAALHATAPSEAETDWARVVPIYDQLVVVDESPVVRLARAVAVGRAEGPAAGLAALPGAGDGPYAEAARGVFLEALGRPAEARRHFELALARARTDPERRLMARRLRSGSAAAGG